MGTCALLIATIHCATCRRLLPVAGAALKHARSILRPAIGYMFGVLGVFVDPNRVQLMANITQP